MEMRVALIYLGRKGGGAAYSRLVAAALARRCEVLSFVSAQAENLPQWRAANLQIVEVSTYASASGLVLSLLDARRQLRLRQQIRGFSPDVIYYPMGHSWTPLINALVPGIPKVLTVHDAVLHAGEASLPSRVLHRLSLRQSSRAIVLTRQSALALRNTGFPDECIDVIPHGEFSFYADISPERPSPRNDGHTLLFFGRIYAYKGIDVLLAAFSQISTRRPSSRLLIVGSGDLRPFASVLATLTNVSIVNRWVADSEVHGFFSQADVVVLPYVDASQSGVIPVAYAHALPVVATDVGGIPEQVEHGKTGLLVPPSDANALALACVDLLDAPALRKEMGRRGAQKASCEWNWDSVAERVLTSLETAAMSQRRE